MGGASPSWCSSEEDDEDCLKRELKPSPIWRWGGMGGTFWANRWASSSIIAGAGEENRSTPGKTGADTCCKMEKLDHINTQVPRQVARA